LGRSGSSASCGDALAPLDASSSLASSRSTSSSNVDTVTELVNLIVAQRAYEVNSRAIRSSDEMMSQVNNLIR